MTVATRPLEGLVVNLSVSQGDDTLKHGYPGWQVNRVTLQFVAALFGQGASLVFGHDWREDGVMEAVHGLPFRCSRRYPSQRRRHRPKASRLCGICFPGRKHPAFRKRNKSS